MRYLLGGFSEDEKTRMEDAFFADDAKFEAIELAEDELIDAYVRKELSSEELRQFKAKVLISPRLLERVRFATTLAEKAASFQTSGAEAPFKETPTPAAETTPRGWKGFFAQRPAYGMAMAACVLLILVAGALLISGWLRLRSESERLAGERAALQRQKVELDEQSAAQQAKIDELNAQAQRQQDPRVKEPKTTDVSQLPDKQPINSRPSAAAFATVVLSSSGVRSSDGNHAQLVIGPHTTIAQLRISLNKIDYPSYNATIRTADDVVIVSKNNLRPYKTQFGQQLLLSVPSQTLPSDDYTVLVEGVTASGQIESVADYAFRVLKQ